VHSHCCFAEGFLACTPENNACQSVRLGEAAVQGPAHVLQLVLLEPAHVVDEHPWQTPSKVKHLRAYSVSTRTRWTIKKVVRWDAQQADSPRAGQRT
jgi:hypothetical protein